MVREITMNEVYEVLDGKGLGLGLYANRYNDMIPSNFNGFQRIETCPDGSKIYLVAAKSPMIAKRIVLNRQD